jgi:hypothetical protein
MIDDEALNNFIAGYVSGEGSFYISAPRTSAGQLQCGFSLKVRDDDRELVEMVRLALDMAGRIYPIESKRYQYEWDTVKRHDAVTLMIRRLSELVNTVIPFFERYPLRGKKRINYDLWKQVVLMMWNDEHLTREGQATILEIRAQMNRY